jgi:hypothetical protein
MTEDKKHMKYLKIENQRGFFCLDPGASTQEWKAIDLITKDDIMSLLDSALANEFDMDLYEENQIGHKAHQIIYKRIFSKFDELLPQKSRFKDDIGNTYKSALEKYAIPISDPPLTVNQPSASQ